MSVRRALVVLLPVALAAALAPPAAAHPPSSGAEHSLRAPVTDENFYFVMADRFANGDTGQRHRRPRPATRWSPASTRPSKGFYNGGDLEGPASKLDYIQGLGTDGDLADAELQEQGGPARGRPVGRLPRLLDHRLHPDRPAPRHQRRTCADAGRRRARARDEGLLRHHHQPHRRRDRLPARAPARPYVSKDAAPVPDRGRHAVRRPRLRRHEHASRRSTRDDVVPLPPGARRRPSRTSRSRPGSTT